MQSLIFGLGAALAWGIHDVCIRHVSQRMAILPMMAIILGAGLLAMAPFVVFHGDWSGLGGQALSLAILAGLVYAAAGFSLYRAFSIGPVRLVAPIVGSFPVLSVLWAALQGQPPTPGQAIAILAIVGGVGAIAALSDETAEKADKRGAAIGWALIAATGFAGTFAIGQAAERAGGGLPSLAITRAVALAAVLIAIAVIRPALPGRRGPWALPVAMGLLDALALGLVLTSGSLPRPEYAVVTSSVFGMVTILLAWAFLREPMRPMQWAGAIIVFSGIGYLAI
ncbi:MAG: DMT family transporter [Rhodobacteraceae bacterium]|nr:DMT family transporter [Paracoccaceae bacterium]